MFDARFIVFEQINPNVVYNRGRMKMKSMNLQK